MVSRRIVMVGVAVMGLSQLGQSQQRFTLSPHQVAQALVDHGIRVSDTQVSLVATVVATDPSPQLVVLSVTPLGGSLLADQPETRTWVRMGCHRQGACLPFYAIVAGLGGQALSTATSSPTQSMSRNAQSGDDADLSMKAGTHATLLLEDHRSRIRLSVITLEKGIAGSKIRVASPDHKRVYIAEIVNSDHLKASF